MLEVIDARQANEASPVGWLQNHYDGSGRVDYQDVGRSSAADTTHRNYIIYPTNFLGDIASVAVVNAEGFKSVVRQFLLNAATAFTPIWVTHCTGTWNSVGHPNRRANACERPELLSVQL